MIQPNNNRKASLKSQSKFTNFPNNVRDKTDKKTNI